MMRTFFKVIAWFGLAWATLCVAYISWGMCMVLPTRPGDNIAAFPIFYLFSAIGLPFILVGGLYGKPRYFWLASLLAGVCYLLSLIVYGFWGSLNNGYIGYGPYSVNNILLLGILSIPGITYVIEGIMLKRIEYKGRNQRIIT